MRALCFLGAGFAAAWALSACGPVAQAPRGGTSARGSDPFPSWAFHPDGCRAFHDLPVEGFLPATLFVPDGPGPHPLVVTAHGAHGEPEGSCRYWCGMTNARAVVLSLRGARTDNTRPSGYYYPTHHALGAELRAARAALRARADIAIDDTRALYSGFSQGAIMGALVLPDHAGEFPRVAFIEGGFQYWSRASAARFAKNGGERVLFACGTEWCRRGSTQIAAWLADVGVDARLEHAPGAGHTAEGRVRERVRASVPWLLGND